uniref:NADH:ubiquinone reductase (H(+)-translocating) n=1 Tax=Ptilonyssus chloris TaxID=2652178 RepID=A0A5Q0RZW4_9ACAR|nr:NADH dehydrogenase subunit 5 [Ptilonyssus chloris]QGA47495.1 NADH dehydrogenase subunit 5 [Ptilonyssus chloris]
MFYKMISFMFMLISLLFMVMFFYVNLYNTSIYVEMSIYMLDIIDMVMYLYFDYISCLFMMVVYLISSCVIYYSYEYMKLDYNYMFLYMMMLFVFSMSLMVLGCNMLMLMLGWDGLGIISYLLIIYYNNNSSMKSGMITFLSNRLGDVGLIISIILMMNMGMLNFNNNYYDFMKMLGFMLMMGALTKSAQFPFSSWLPAAMAAPTPVSSLVHSSTLVTAGVYLLIRMNYMFNLYFYSKMLLIISLFTMMMSGLMALLEFDLKKIIALSTLSQLGLMMMIMSLGMYELCMYHLVVHAMYKSMLFLCMGYIIHMYNNVQDIRMLGMVWLVSPSVSMMMLLGFMSLFGFPFLSGFYSKDLILEIMYLYNNSFIVLIMVIMSYMLTLMYSMRLVYYLCFKQIYMNISMKVSDKWAIYPINFLGYMVVIFGSMVMWIFFKTPVYVFTFFLYKLMSIIMLFMMMWMCVYIYEIMDMYNIFMFKNNKLYYFINDMFYLNSLTNDVFIKFISMKKYDIIDIWLEDLEGMGLYKEISIMMYMLYNMYIKNMYLYYMMFIIMMIMFLV